MACYFHTEFAHAQRYGQRLLTDRAFDAAEHVVAVETTQGSSPWTFVSCPNEVKDCEEHGPEAIAHNGAIIIAVDGACRGNGTPNARAATGVFFHPNNHGNQASLLQGTQPQTNQRAELTAALSALKIATRIRARNFKKYHAPRGPYRKLRRVVIKTDSSYLVKGITNYIYDWRLNGFTNIHGRPVKNKYLFLQIDRAITVLNRMQTAVQFWYVPRGQNQDADRLANEALNDVGD